MAAIFVSLILITINTVAAQERQLNISQGSSLTPTTNSTWQSPSGLFAFGFYQQGTAGYAVGIFMAGVPQKTVVWAANRNQPPVPSNVTLLLTRDGRLVLTTPQGEETNIVESPEPASVASILDSGNFVLYNSAQQITWQSFENPTTTLLPGQRLLPGRELISSVSETDQSTGVFRLKMQQDGNLVQYPVNTTDTAGNSYWSTATVNTEDKRTLNLDEDGRLYLLNSTGFNIKTVIDGGYPTNETINLFKLDVDGILRLYSYKLNQKGNRSVVWNSTNNNCDAKGLCGPNAYCINNDQQAECKCLPGFVNVIAGDWISGCQRNFTAQDCKSNVGKNEYIINEVESTRWEDDTYSYLSLPTKEDCKAACLEDCICEAATYKDGNCQKQKLPLRYGKRDLGDSNVALIKVGKLSSAEATPTGAEATPKGDAPHEIEKEDQMNILFIGVSLIVFACIVLAIAGVLIYRNHAWAYKKLSGNGHNRLSEEVAPTAFTYAEIEKVTDNFKQEVGRGAFGTVYKGTILNGQKVIAVKKLERVSTEGEREFQTEMKIIGRTHHRSLVRLLGYCHEESHRLLVYEYMSNGSLADVLFSPEKQPCWNERMEFARSVARGLLYLHEECETQIIHCDIKPQNILLDEYRCAKISDFGLAKLLNADQTRTFTGIRGTRGYVAPEWHKKLPVTVKADVYSFGVVLLEIICCRKGVDWSLSNEEAIVEEWVYAHFMAGELGVVVGDEKVDIREVERMVKVSLWCIHDEPLLRPSMKKVLLMLEGILEVPMPPSPFSFSVIN